MNQTDHWLQSKAADCMHLLKQTVSFSVAKEEVLSNHIKVKHTKR